MTSTIPLWGSGSHTRWFFPWIDTDRICQLFGSGLIIEASIPPRRMKLHLLVYFLNKDSKDSQKFGTGKSLKKDRRLRKFAENCQKKNQKAIWQSHCLLHRPILGNLSSVMSTRDLVVMIGSERNFLVVTMDWWRRRQVQASSVALLMNLAFLVRQTKCQMMHLLLPTAFRSPRLHVEWNTGWLICDNCDMMI